ncbi:MAG: hypothetical protein QOD41_658 [Cryptosporangiaceae bacterium]|nr:hypothetical protein [Cryptosporangiaceae bacterium]
MRRVLLTPRWLAGHLLAVAACGVCLWLGWWQWGRAQHGGDLQNLGYALQWPLFGAFFIYAWVRVVRIELSRGSAESAQPATAPQPPAVPAARPAWAWEPPVAEDDEDDEELAAYNRHLAALHAQDALRPDRP